MPGCRHIHKLMALVQKQFKFPDNSLELYAEKVQYHGLSAVAQCESLQYKLLGGLAVHRCPKLFCGIFVRDLTTLPQGLLWHPPLCDGVEAPSLDVLKCHTGTSVLNV